MPDVTIELRTLSPIYVGAQKPYGRFLETETHIPGSVLRGAVTESLLREAREYGLRENHDQCAEPTVCPFCHYTAGVTFHPLHVADGTGPTETPLHTMMTCKRFPGFKTDSRRGTPCHGVVDMLLHHIAYVEASEVEAQAPLPPSRCEGCAAVMDRYWRRYVRDGPGRGHGAEPVRRRRMTHVAINPARETAERGLLYSVQVIAEGTRFLGRVGIPEEWDQKRVEEFKELLAGVRFIGARRSQGLGRVETRISEEWPELESLVTRIEAFNEKLGEVRRSYAGRDDVPADSAGKGYFSVDLATPAILSGNDGCPKLELTPAILAAEAERLGFPGLPQVTALQLSISPGDERSVFFVEAETIGGWSPAWGLPKPTAPAAAAGSVFVFRATDLPKLCEALAAVEGRGIGLRREEGFGKVRICDPIHMEVRPI